LTVQQPRGGVNNPYDGIGNPFPFEPPQTDAEKTAYKWVYPMAITQWNPNFRNAVVQQWNISIQRQLARSWVFTTAYVGSKGNHLFMTAEANPGIPGTPGSNLN